MTDCVDVNDLVSSVFLTVTRPGEMFHMSVGFISQVHLKKSPQKRFGKGRAFQKHLGKGLEKALVTFKVDQSDQSKP